MYSCVTSFYLRNHDKITRKTRVSDVLIQTLEPTNTGMLNSVQETLNPRMEVTAQTHSLSWDYIQASHYIMYARMYVLTYVFLYIRMYVCIYVCELNC